ncbi:hypothetical protein GO988_07125 [Hymenobacter sp. HMF4947]|uniref:Roadblock/LAMTOR2 domain-containing protein n=1 Tax=Hymenobacter ginkgonis TaxID=2682976 RepID=A0A7K1TCN4_9BACT|nr:hypothetical protein [Hymenobacter ginkgonis]MVN76092.1 hypothetical protein [Hymenobacter ginkgonis]
MKIPFLRHLPLLGGPPIRQVVAGTGSQAPGAAAALQHLLTELPDLLMAAVLEVATGQLLATYAAERDYQPSLLATPVVAVVRQLQANQAAQGPAAEELEEVVLTLSSQLHLLRLRPGGQQFLYLAVDIRDTNLAIARELMRQAIEQIDSLN